MAKKDFDKYFYTICDQYKQLQNVLKDLSLEVSNGMVEPERLEQLKQTIIPVENNYRTLSYIKYLLDMPKRKSKISSYKNRNKKLLEEAKDKTGQNIKQENANIISSLTI